MDYRIQSITGTSGLNEDIADHVNNYFWIIDGASSLDDSGLVFARNFSRKLRGVLARELDTDLRALVADALSQVSPAYKGTATIALARINEHTVDYFVLGDCFIYTEDHHHITDARLSTIATVERAVHEALRTEESHKALLDEEAKFRNKDEGFWVLEARNTSVVHNAIVGTFTHRDFIMGSDGAVKLVKDLTKIRNTDLRSERKAQTKGTQLSDLYFDDATTIDVYLS